MARRKHRGRRRSEADRATSGAAAGSESAPLDRSRARQQKRSRYAWHRRVPWPALIALAAVLVAAVLITRQLGVGEGAGRYVAGAGVGDHRPVGQAVAYPSYPPTSGTHWSSPSTWGFHSEPVADEAALHNLEHGGVVASQNNIPAEDLARLRALLSSYPRDRYNEVKLLIRPYDKIAPGTLVLTAWNWIDELPAYDEARVRAFLDAHLNKCCESVP